MGHRGLDLTGKVAVVVGATSGIGRELALGLAQAGADVVATARRAAQVDEVAAEIEALGRKTVRVACDVTDAASLGAARETIEAKVGPVGILVNCAGRTKRAPSLEMDIADWQAILDTNLTGTFLACRAFAPGMIERGWGRIVNIASLASFVGLLEVAAYTASKSGGGRPHARARRRVGAEGRERERHRSRRLPHAISTRPCSTAPRAGRS